MNKRKIMTLIKFMIFCSLGCVVSYLVISLSPNPFLSLAGCAMCGFFVAIAWPGVLSLAASHYKTGSAAMFGVLALSGDIGCFLGPEVVATASKLSLFGSPLKTGIFCAIVFPLLMLAGIVILNKKISTSEN